MLVFGALIDLSGQQVSPLALAGLTQALPPLSGRIGTYALGDITTVHLADERPLPNDADLPLCDGGIVVAGVLRIDARETLRADLGDAAATEPGASDAASDARLVWLAYRRWGDRLAEHLIGDFAFVLWDRAERRLVCARDHHGNRHLFWRLAGTQVVVASAIALVRDMPGVSGELCETSLVSLLRDGFIEDAERTVFREIRRVPAAHTLVLELGAAPRLRRHWDYPVPAQIRYRRESDYVEHFAEVLDSAVRDRVRGGAAAILLSGGLDSTTIAASARRVAPEASLRGITLTYPTLAPTDDDRLAGEVAQRLHMSYLALDLEHFVALEHIEDATSLPPQPFDESDLGLWRATTRTAAAFAPVALFGEDGDTLLRAPTLLHQIRTLGVAETVRSWLGYAVRTGRRPWVGLEWRRRLSEWWRPPRASFPWLWADAVRRAGVIPRARAAHPLRPITTSGLSSPQWDAVYTTMAPATTLSPVLFTLPLVDPRVLAFVFAIPPVPFCQNKYLFRTAMRGVLPEGVVDRPKVTLSGFIETRVAQWRAKGGAEASISHRVAPWVDIAAVRNVYRGGDPFSVVDAWRVVQLDRWLAREESRRA